MALKIPEGVRDIYIQDAWAYMTSRYPPDLLKLDGILKSEVRGIADLMAQVNVRGQCISWDEIDMIRYAQDFLEFRGTGCLYKIFLLLYDREAWKVYKNSAKGERCKMLIREERKVNDFLEKERKGNGKNK